MAKYPTSGGTGTVVDASDTVKGITKLSVAPAVAANPVAVGDNDARNTNARTPTAHAASHGTGSTDPVTIAEAQVTGLVADLAAKDTALAAEATARAAADTAEATARAAADALKAQGLIATAVKTANYAAAAADFVPVDVSGGSVTVTLPTAPADRTRIGVKIIATGGANTLTVARGGTDVFNKAGGSTSLSLSFLNQAAILQYDAGTGIWYVQSTDAPISSLVIAESQVTNLVADLAAKDTALAAEATTRANADTAEATARANADALLAPLASPALTGTPTVPTAAPGTNTTQAASTAFTAAAVAAEASARSTADALLATIASPTFTGDPKAPTPAAGDNDTSIATTAYVQGELANLVVLAPATAARNTIQPTADVIPLTVKGKVSQSANLQQWSSSSAALTAITSNGDIDFAGSGGTTRITIQGGVRDLMKIEAGSRIGIQTVMAFRPTATIEFFSAGGATTSDATDTRLRKVAAGILSIATTGTSNPFTAPTMTGAGLMLENASAAPSTNPVGGPIIYAEGGALKCRGTGGTITVLGPA